MRIHRFLSVTDLVVAGVLAVAMFLPKRPTYADDAYRLEADARADLAAAEARALAHPDDGVLAAELARRLSRGRQLDWAVEAARDGAARATEPTQWRALLAVSEAYADRIDVAAAHQWAGTSLDACHAAKDLCPAWEELKIDMYQRYLDAGLKSGIDPRENPRGFRREADKALRAIDTGKLDPNTPSPAPAVDGGAAAPGADAAP